MALGQSGGAQGRGSRAVAPGLLRQLQSASCCAAPPAGVLAIYDTLMAANPDEATAEYGLLAETVELPADRKRRHLRAARDARWHDGRPVTAEDVVFTFNALRDQGRPFYRAYWADVTEVVAETPRRVTFTLPRRRQPRTGADPGRPARAAEALLGGAGFRAAVAGSCRWVAVPTGLSGSSRAAASVYRRVAGLLGARPRRAARPEQLRSMRYEYFRDSTVTFEAFKAGQTDFRQENIAQRLGDRLRLPGGAAGPREEGGDPAPDPRPACSASRSTCAGRCSRMPGAARADRGLRLRMDEREPVLRRLYADELVLLQFRLRLARPARRARAGHPGDFPWPRARQRLHRGIQAAGHRWVRQQPRRARAARWR